MADADNKPNSQQQPKPEPRLDQKQYELLIKCSEEKDMTEWNEYRNTHVDEEIWLEDANLMQANLEGAALMGANLKDAMLIAAHLEGAALWRANLEHANLKLAHLEGAALMEAHLEGADLWAAHLEGAALTEAHLEGAKLREAHLEGAKLMRAYLQGAMLLAAHLEGADLTDARLQGASLSRSHLQGAKFETAVVDGETAICYCQVDRETNFFGVGLDSCRIDPATKQLLEHNVRRMNWQEWYHEHRFLEWPVRCFWYLSNYGLSTWRVIIWFFVLSFLFAAVYSNLAYWFPPGVVNDLFTIPEPSGQVSRLDLIDYGLEVFFRPIYFSVVTMTTLGFGDMYARPGSWLGHVLLMFQVILGYVLLGALITRFAILFTAGGPAGTFSERKPKEQAKSAKDERENANE